MLNLQGVFTHKFVMNIFLAPFSIKTPSYFISNSKIVCMGYKPSSRLIPILFSKQVLIYRWEVEVLL